MDGHVKKMAVGAMAAGTNYLKTQDRSLTTVTDSGKYIWDLQ